MAAMTSQITFLYVEDMKSARKFFNETLELQTAYDPKWACVWRVAEKAFVGVAEVEKGSIEVHARGGTLISLTVENVQEWHHKLRSKGYDNLPDIKHFEDIGLLSFIFKGPEGYDFEIQQFLTPELQAIF